jgi:transcriptional regulator with XRE-family HTH domain
MNKDQSMRKLLADRVRIWMSRVAAAGTQAKLSTRAGMSQSSVHRVLNEGTEPELVTAHKLAQAFGITVSELLNEDDDANAAYPFDLKRYAGLPASEKEKIKSFAEFIFATHEISTSAGDEPAAVSETTAATDNERALVSRVAQRNLITDTLSEHETTQKQNQKATRNRRKSARN